LIADDDLNRAAVVREVHAAFEQYERDLRRHDVAALNNWFLARPDTVRFGITEHNYGAAAIAAWRQQAAPVHAARRILRVVITTFGDDTASVCAEFAAPDSPLRGRQTQTWLRHASGWKIIAAHVSLIDPQLLAAP
jgi:ketosteroid isomerase-like protein